MTFYSSFSLYFLVFFHLFFSYNVLGELYSPYSKVTPYLIILFILLSVFYLFAYFTAKYVDINPIIKFFLPLLCIVLFFIQPILSQDVYWNLTLGKGFVLFKLNPYLNSPNDILKLGLPMSLDRYVIVWRHLAMTHGPASTLLHTLAAFPSSVVANILTLKLFSFAAFFVSLRYFYKILLSLKVKDAYLKLFYLSFNPVILINLLVDLHNDVYIMMLLILSFYFLLKDKLELSFVFIILGVFTKYITLIFVPIYLYMLYMKSPLKSVKAGVIAALIGIVLYIPFIGDLVRNPSLIGDFMYGARYGVVQYYALGSTPGYVLLHELFGITVAKFFVLFGSFFFPVYYLRKKEYLNVYLVPLLFIMFFISSFQVWYLSWVLPFLVIRDNRLFTGLLTFFAFFSTHLSSLELLSIFLLLYISYYLIIKKWSFKKSFAKRQII